MKKILFIDDNADLREEILEALQFEGFDVLGASDGLEGIEVAKLEKPDLILCDIRMPEIDGFEVYKQIKSHTSTALIPFIFLTALAEQDEVRKGMEIGVDDYIVKPISLEDLLRVIYIRLQKSIEINNRIQTQLNELKDKILHIIPHELLTPLNGILGFANLIKNDAESMNKREIQESASLIELSGNRLHNIINNYLNDILIISDNNFDTERTRLSNVHEIIAEVSINVAEKYDRIDDLIFKLENAELAIEHDDFIFLIRELVDNAFKFSEAKSKVAVMNNVYRNNMEIHIIDHGVGFPVDNLSGIDEFSQVDRKKLLQNSSSDPGLGLITSMLIAQRYNGSLKITNSTLETTVNLTLPT